MVYNFFPLGFNGIREWFFCVKPEYFFSAYRYTDLSGIQLETLKASTANIDIRGFVIVQPPHSAAELQSAECSGEGERGREGIGRVRYMHNIRVQLRIWGGRKCFELNREIRNFGTEF